MKLEINFDFFEAILNTNEKMTPMKIIRNEKKLIAFWYIPILTILNSLCFKDLRKEFEVLIIEFGMLIGSVLFHNILNGTDIYKDKSINDLKILVSKLKDLYINTDYDLIKTSELVSKKIQIKFNRENILSIMESKYILVPTYDYKMDIKNTTILQEHEIGTNSYILSIGSPKKAFKPAYSNI